MGGAPGAGRAKGLRGASVGPPGATRGSEPPLALLSIADRDKWGLLDLARALVRAGYRLAATAGTRAALADAGLDALPVAKLGSAPQGDETAILELIDGGRVRLGVNTPTPRAGPRRGAAADP